MVKIIRLNSIPEDAIIKLIAGVFNEPTTRSTYTYIGEILSIYKVEESSKEFYLVLSALESLYEIYSIRGTIPTISTQVIMSIVNNNLYSELKENKNVGYDDYTLTLLNQRLDIYDEATLSKVFSSLRDSVETYLNEASNLKYTIEDSRASIPIFLENYVSSLAEELAQLLNLFSTNDSDIIRRKFWGWKDFLYRFKIRSILDITKLLMLVAQIIESKNYEASKRSLPLTRVEQIIAMEDKFISADIPLAFTKFPALNDSIRLVPHDITLIVGERGLGKTTLAGYLAGDFLAQGKRVLFYSPEIANYRLLFSFILPSFIYAKYGFKVTQDQCLGLEPPYEYGGELSPDEKSAIIKLAKLEIAESGLFYHIDKKYNLRTLEDEIRTNLTDFSPDFFLIDHTQEINGEGQSMNVVTERLAEALDNVKRDFLTHTIALAHPGGDFKIPTKDKPIVTSKIVSWSAKMEAVADNVIGAFGNGEFMNFFFTKLRWAKLVSMYLVFRKERQHGLLVFRNEDQVSKGVGDIELDKYMALTKSDGVLGSGSFGMEDEDDDHNMFIDDDED